ncbi:hypothetical protein BCR36DRAFT_580621 [Piromyces finnis]|uniref:Uncharacterized protein n=1 Tax=Piromyces finnis TaxID=1754191 RepID=A0A1Y1VIJ6_9FUNG|nr:hypothetical protein BCR36DRAFT_580621 [Piromyces finnis]|eukprot:ORX57213.1 hypothetical protein BCR36DRAFT_580621 [Piromyces finnis]
MAFGAGASGATDTSGASGIDFGAGVSSNDFGEGVSGIDFGTAISSSSSAIKLFVTVGKVLECKVLECKVLVDGTTGAIGTSGASDNDFGTGVSETTGLFNDFGAGVSGTTGTSGTTVVSGKAFGGKVLVDGTTGAIGSTGVIPT